MCVMKNIISQGWKTEDEEFGEEAKMVTAVITAVFMLKTGTL